MQQHPPPCWRNTKHSPERPRDIKSLICRVAFAELLNAAYQMLRVKCPTLPEMRTPSGKWYLVSMCLEFEVHIRFFAHQVDPEYFSNCDTWHTYRVKITSITVPAIGKYFCFNLNQ